MALALVERAMRKAVKSRYDRGGGWRSTLTTRPTRAPRAVLINSRDLAGSHDLSQCSHWLQRSGQWMQHNTALRAHLVPVTKSLEILLLVGRARPTCYWSYSPSSGHERRLRLRPAKKRLGYEQVSLHDNTFGHPVPGARIARIARIAACPG